MFDNPATHSATRRCADRSRLSIRRHSERRYYRSLRRRLCTSLPPVYIKVDGEAGAYTQMHADGGVRETAFFFDYDSMEEFRLELEAAGFSDSDFDYQLYLLINGPIAFPGIKTYKPVEARIGAVADATITSLMTKVTQGSVYRLWVLAMAHGADFHLSFVPPDYEF